MPLGNRSLKYELLLQSFPDKPNMHQWPLGYPRLSWISDSFVPFLICLPRALWQSECVNDSFSLCDSLPPPSFIVKCLARCSPPQTLSSTLFLCLALHLSSSRSSFLFLYASLSLSKGAKTSHYKIFQFWESPAGSFYLTPGVWRRPCMSLSLLAFINPGSGLGILHHQWEEALNKPW